MSPIPNQRISQGARAYFGMPMVNMMAGSTASVARGERRSRNGRITPTIPAMAKPATATRSVAMMSATIWPFSASSHRRCAVSSGGAKNSGPSVRAPYSQPASSAIVRTMRPP